jgi:hypothetical protein
MEEARISYKILFRKIMERRAISRILKNIDPNICKKKGCD